MGEHFTILVVEDEPLVMKLVKAVLLYGRDSDSGLRRHYKVLCATSAAEALRIGAEYSGIIHLLLADVFLGPEGEMLGTDLALQLKETRPEIRVILMTGKPDGELAVLQGGWQVLQKPFVGVELLGRIRAALTVRAAGG